MFGKLASLIEANVDELATVLSRESGKVFDEARDAEDFRPVFRARPELFDLPAALPAAHGVASAHVSSWWN